MTYTVKFKCFNNFFWKKLRNVKADGFVEGVFSEAGANELSSRIRYFILQDESRIEIPANTHLFKFSKERFLSIKMAMEHESGQNIKTRLSC